MFVCRKHLLLRRRRALHNIVYIMFCTAQISLNGIIYLAVAESNRRSSIVLVELAVGCIIACLLLLPPV